MHARERFAYASQVGALCVQCEIGYVMLCYERGSRFAPQRVGRSGARVVSAMVRRLAMLALLLHDALAAHTPSAPRAPTNVVLFFVDDLGYGDLGTQRPCHSRSVPQLRPV
jgi:hypothetical protein